MSVKKSKRKTSPSRSGRLVLLALAVLGLIVAVILSKSDVTLLNPKGLIAQQQTHLMLFSVGVMLTFAIPTLIIFYFVAWKYRESNQNTTYEPNRHNSKLVQISLWAFPVVIVTVLASAMIPITHILDPHKQIASTTKPLTIQVIAMRWKWLFIYPNQSIATVNFVQVPTNTPIQFDLTADEAPMSSFWIPHWGGQLYAMTGHSNQLNLMADTPGNYSGRTAEINGDGFAGMKFTAKATSKQDFDQWVRDTQQSTTIFDSEAYAKLLAPSENTPQASYFTTQPDLYSIVLAKYSGSHGHTEQE